MMSGVSLSPVPDRAGTPSRFVRRLLFLPLLLLFVLGCGRDDEEVIVCRVTTTFETENLENSDQVWHTVRVKNGLESGEYYSSEFLGRAEVEYNGHTLPYSLDRFAYCDPSLYAAPDGNVFTVMVDPENAPPVTFYSLRHPMAWPHISIPDTIPADFSFRIDCPQDVDRLIFEVKRGNSFLFNRNRDVFGLRNDPTLVVDDLAIEAGDSIDWYVYLHASDGETEVGAGQIGAMTIAHQKIYRKKCHVGPATSQGGDHE